MKTDRYSRKFSREVAAIPLLAGRINWKRPAAAMFWTQNFFTQVKAHRRRNRMLREGVTVPPVMICSITSRCNLTCKGCYAADQKRDCTQELSTARYAEIFDEAANLGTSIIILAGGEPLMRGELLRNASSRSDIIFPVFTNGTLLNNGNLETFSRHRNMIPVLSVEGYRAMTDSRRGKGTWQKVRESAALLKDEKVMYGISVTLTSENFDLVMSPPFINEYFELGARLFFFVEYVPTGENDMQLCLTEEQKSRLKSRIINLRLVFPALVMALPGDEERFGGCLAAGRGFMHLSSAGNLEACPFAPWSDSSVLNRSLASALKSEFMQTLREQHDKLGESMGGCTLRSNPEWVASKLKETRPTPTREIKKQQLEQAV